MKLVLAEPKFLKDSISIISELVTEARFTVKKEGLELTAMDPANVAMVSYKLLASSFSEYDTKATTSLSVNLGNFKQILRRAGPGDTLVLETQENKLKVIIRGASTRTFHLPLIELEEREQRVPDLKFNATVTTEALQLQSAIEDADIVAESLAFVAEEKSLQIVAEGDLSRALIEIVADNHTTIVVKEGSKVRARYSIEYLKKMIQAARLSDKVTIEFSKDYPLKLSFKVVDKLSMEFILAPRVENE
jgi:proliferating cell nuclear antigen